jgi:hypothetical protein
MADNRKRVGVPQRLVQLQPSCCFTSGVATLNGVCKEIKCEAHQRGHNQAIVVNGVTALHPITGDYYQSNVKLFVDTVDTVITQEEAEKFKHRFADESTGSIGTTNNACPCLRRKGVMYRQSRTVASGSNSRHSQTPQCGSFF